uniref:MORN repeat-containing protein 5 n=1 Tax=Bicosoecida sp. CB-2014 TaxID=1486930 RepID=A0A7S1C5G3_9STRA
MADEEEVKEVAAPEPQKGTGTFVYPDGSRYEGEWASDVDGVRRREGQGTFDDGVERYEGSWVADKMDGQGKFVFATGAVYEGGFADNVFSGSGRYEWKDGATYEGGWRQGRMHGDGTYVDPEGVSWAGEFYNGKFNNGRAHINLR